MWLAPGWGQVQFLGFMDAGSSTVSSGFSLKPSVTGTYNFRQFHGSTGLQWTFSEAERQIFSGWFIHGGFDFTMEEQPFSAILFFRSNPYSGRTAEHNLGTVIRHERKYLEIHLGYHARLYTLDYKTEATGGPVPGADLRLWEPRNFIYRGTLSLHEQPAIWNLSATVTNYDHFLIQQETNPMLSMAGHYRISDGIRIHSSVWYQGAGMLNLHANHYGFYFRTGIQWQLGR